MLVLSLIAIMYAITCYNICNIELIENYDTRKKKKIYDKIIDKESILRMVNDSIAFEFKFR